MIAKCEESGRVRDAFARVGWEAWSCDLLPSATPGNHIRGDARDVGEDWDLSICFPPCTYLCNSGVRWLAPGGKINPDRHRMMQEACDLFAHLYWSGERVAVENPVMHCYARDYLASAWKIPTFTQSIQPWQFGHGETKRTCLWLRNLPPLVPTDIVAGREQRIWKMSPGPNRARERSRTFPGIAAAMAAQWGSLEFSA